MPVTPFLWNIVVVGAWNRAILTPDGVRRRLFGLPDGTPVEVEVAIDVPGPFRIAHEGILVIPMTDKLITEARKPDLDSLVRASEVCSRALDSLPETPVSAAGINIRYRFTELPDAVLDLTRAPIDAAVSDAGFEIASMTTSRSIIVAPGVANVRITQTRGEGTLEFNFHRDSGSHAELAAWLGRTAEFGELSDRLAVVLGVGDVRREIHA